MYTVGNIYAITAVAVIGGGLFGFDIASMSAIITTRSYTCYFNQGPLYFETDGKCSGPTPDVQGGITAAMPGGSWLGALCSGYFSDIFGRKRAIQIGAVVWCVGCVLVCASQNIGMLIAGRIVNGFAVGICSAQVPVYLTEIAPPSKRGRLVGCQQWAITWGILIMFYISFGTSEMEGTASFRIPWGLQAVPAVLLFFFMMFLPESPRWLARKDRWEEAKSVLALVHAHGDMNSLFVAREMAEIEETVNFERRNADVTYLELFKPGMINRTHIGIFTQIWSQLTGMNVMMYYIAYLFTMAGLGSAVLLSSSIQYIINVGMTIPALLWVDRWGRRPTLLIGAAFMAIWMYTNAGLLATYSVVPYEGQFQNAAESMSIEGPPSKAVIACTYLFVASFAISWGPVSWVYPPELFPLRVRSKAVALTTSSNWVFNFALAYFVPPAFVSITWKVYILFGVFCTAMFLHVLFLFPETAGKRLEEVEDMFDDTKPGSIRFLGTPAWKTRVVTRDALRVERGEMGDEEKFNAAVNGDARHIERGSNSDVVPSPTGRNKQPESVVRP